jgi:hypothetical protein
MITIFVGDVGEYLSFQAKAFSPDATLIDFSNCSNLKSGTYYTSLGDLSDVPTFIQVINCADVLIYSPPDKWSDSGKKNKNGFNMQIITEFYLLYYKSRKSVTGIDHLVDPVTDIILELQSLRVSDNPQLWVAGCSSTYGQGLTNINDRYGQIVSDKLSMPATFLARMGTSIPWSADQILRSDIRTGDTVLWGLTTWNRLAFFQENAQQLTHVNVSYYERNPAFDKILSIDRICERSNLQYNCVTSVYQVVNMCRKLGVNLILCGILTDWDDIKHYAGIPEFIQFYGVHGLNKNELYHDVADDRMHPGIESHKWIANEIIKRIKNGTIRQC